MTPSTLLSLLSVAAAVQAHMQLFYPPPFNASNNPHTSGASDPYLQFPYACCGPNARWTYPCRGYLSLLGTPAGAPVATWPAGSKQNFNLTGIGNHYGGSCQVGFSVDKGATFQVATSYEGNCPLRNNGDSPSDQDFAFAVPADMPTGDAVFAWTWINREQEFNMNCAAVTITSGDDERDGGAGGEQQGPGSTPQGYGSAPSSSLATAAAATSSSAASAMAYAPPSAAAASQPPGYSNLDDCVCNCTSTSPGPSSALVIADGCACTCNAPLSQPAKRHAGRHARAAQFRPPKGLALPGLKSGPGVWGGGEEKRAAATVAYAQRPRMLVADTGNGCRSPRATAELKYPDPGPDVVQGDGEYPLELPTGDC